MPMWTATVAWLHVRETQNDRETGCPVDANMACTAMFINCSQYGYIVSRQKRIYIYLMHKGSSLFGNHTAKKVVRVVVRHSNLSPLSPAGG